MSRFLLRLIAVVALVSAAGRRREQLPPRPSAPTSCLIYTMTSRTRRIGCYPGSFAWARRRRSTRRCRNRGSSFTAATAARGACRPGRRDDRPSRRIESMRMQGSILPPYDQAVPLLARVFSKRLPDGPKIGKWHTGVDAGWGRDWDYQIVWNVKLPKNAGAATRQILAINGEEARRRLFDRQLHEMGLRLYPRRAPGPA